MAYDDHYIEKCKHGVTIAQCRCPGGVETLVPCPEYHNEPGYKPGDPWPPVKVPDEIAAVYDTDGPIAAMRALRATNPGMSMMKARDAIVQWAENR